MDSMSYHSLESAKITARSALAAHREQKDAVCDCIASIVGGEHEADCREQSHDQ